MCKDWFHRFKDYSFGQRGEKRENRPRKVEDHQLPALLDEDNTQSQKMLVEQLGVTQTLISKGLRGMGKV